MRSEEITSKEELKKNRRIALIIGISMSIALIAIVYAFVQKGVADENLRISNRTMKLADSLRTQLQQREKVDSFNQIMIERANRLADSLHNLSMKKK